MVRCAYRSGTEEDYSELAQLLKDIHTYMCDLEETRAREKGQKEKKDLDERTQAEDMRRAAMEGLVKSSTLGKRGREKSCDSPAEISSADYFVVDLDDDLSEDIPSKKKGKDKPKVSGKTVNFPKLPLLKC